MGERRHAPERGVSDPGGHAVVAAALVLQPCLGEFRRGLEEGQEVEIEVEAPSGPMRYYEPNMTGDVVRNEVDCDLRACGRLGIDQLLLAGGLKVTWHSEKDAAGGRLIKDAE